MLKVYQYAALTSDLDKKNTENAARVQKMAFLLSKLSQETAFESPELLTIGKETIIGMVNHWPSRSGGEEASEPKRMIAANAARKFIDSIQSVSPKTKIVFMGDLNDYPTNNSAKLIAEVDPDGILNAPLRMLDVLLPVVTS